MAPADHRAAYDALTEQLLTNLATVESRDSARRFARDGAKLVRREQRKVPEFYVGEFVGVLKDTLVARYTAESDRLQEAIEEAKMDTDIGTVELTARLEAATAAGDHNAQHELWKEREGRQLAINEKIDASGALAKKFSGRLDAFQRLATALGVTLS
ncbi:hypothetical protein ACVGOW_08980 [Pseudonocardia saturnea]